MRTLIYNKDCLEGMKKIPSNLVDLVVTDPPYGLRFMGKDWDKALPSIEIWKECLRVLKEGAFAFVMCIPRQDCLSKMILLLGEAGFKIDYTSIYWTYASGFPKAANVGKIVDRGMGVEREIVGQYQFPDGKKRNRVGGSMLPQSEGNKDVPSITSPSSPQAQALDGSYVGLQLKPAVEIILTVQKPITTKYKRSDLYMILDKQQDYWYTAKMIVTDTNKEQLEQKWNTEFDEGDVIERRIALNPDLEDEVIVNREMLPESAEKTFPFMITPKPSKREKNEGLEKLPKKQMYKQDNSAESLEIFGTTDGGRQPRQNIHPTVKPVKLMSWLITLGSKEGDLVLDPFMGSGSTGIGAQLLNRHFIGFELEKEYFEIAKLRLKKNV
jgi:site-specific DNA-methyltransferase (adenine-specific)